MEDIMQNSNSRIKLNIIDDIAYVSLSRPDKHNALDIHMFTAIRDTINTLKHDRNVRVVIVQGAGEDFCSGLDIKAVMGTKSSPLKLLFKWLPWQSNLAQFVSTGWRKIPVPVIAAIHGRCWGGGLQIALGADIRIASPDASIAIMEARWGLIPDMGGTLALKELINLDIAKELAMTGKEINGDEALNYGLITHVDKSPIEKAQNIAKEICQQSPDSVAATKRLYDKSWWSSPSLALARESLYQIKILLGKNYKVKTYNQLHKNDKTKDFKTRQRW